MAISESKNAGVSRRSLMLSILATAAASSSITAAIVSGIKNRDSLKEAEDMVLPVGGYRTGLKFGQSIKILTDNGVISRDKFSTLYEQRGGMPDWVSATINGQNDSEIVFTEETAPHLLNLLWPLGLANKATFNDRSPINGDKRDNFASTGGWILGKADNGGIYFNSVEAVKLTAEQDKQVGELADGIYRPCCNNSALFQDCNHGSAMLGLLQLAASQGKSKGEMLRIGVGANAVWYPDKYVMMALHLNEIDGRGWKATPDHEILGGTLSSIGGWMQNVAQPVQRAGILPRFGGGGGGGGCSV